MVWIIFWYLTHTVVSVVIIGWLLRVVFRALQARPDIASPGVVVPGVVFSILEPIATAFVHMEYVWSAVKVAQLLCVVVLLAALSRHRCLMSAEGRVRQEQEALVLAFLPSMAVLTDKGLNIQYASGSLVREAGVTSSDLHGKPVQEVLHTAKDLALCKENPLGEMSVYYHIGGVSPRLHGKKFSTVVRAIRHRGQVCYLFQTTPRVDEFPALMKDMDDSIGRLKGAESPATAAG